jgi:hypothetical protein
VTLEAPLYESVLDTFSDVGLLRCTEFELQGEESELSLGSLVASLSLLRIL